ncbi:VOC family protein [Demequina sp.]|uniref:VOC family protein n=1 Tax=Demequina sp. TaxID=2050685 RepID=UPI003D0E6BB4
MSEDGWRAFLEAASLEDWAVLHGGAVTVYGCDSLADALRLADAVARVPGFAPSGAVLTLGNDRLSVRLTQDMWALTPEHVELARAVSAAARAAGFAADRSRIQEVQIAISAQPAEISLPFWRAVLGYRPADEDNGNDPLAHSSVAWMQPLPEDKPLRHAMHIDVSVPKEFVEARVAAAVAAGGTIVADDEAPEFWILADAAGNKVCVCAWPDGARAQGP